MRLKWSIDQLYFYLVCFVMLITMIIGVTNLVRAGIDLIIPYPDANWKQPGRIVYPEPPGNTQSRLPQDIIERELEQHEEFMRERDRKNALHEAILSFARGFAMLVVAFPVYIYHWRKIPMLA